MGKRSYDTEEMQTLELQKGDKAFFVYKHILQRFQSKPLLYVLDLLGLTILVWTEQVGSGRLLTKTSTHKIRIKCYLSYLPMLEKPRVLYTCIEVL